MKIYIIGQSGAGKSWMAKHLSEKLNIPHIQIDLLWAKAGGIKTYGADKTPLPEGVRKKLMDSAKKAMTQKNWVLDGNYRSTVQPEALKRSDIVIMMDAPFPRRLVNNFSRHFSGEDHRRGFTTRHFLTKHLPRFIRKGNSARAGQLKTARSHPKHYLVTSRKEALALLRELTKSTR